MILSQGHSRLTALLETLIHSNKTDDCVLGLQRKAALDQTCVKLPYSRINFAAIQPKNYSSGLVPYES